MLTRRSFLRTAAASGGALSLGLVPDLTALVAQQRPKLRILVLGGTGFIGPYQVQYALDRGHTVTLFNRGRTNPQLFPTVEKLIGDRATDLKSLEGRDWDVVIDNSVQTDPTWVTKSAQLLAPRVKQYIFVSTRSVYKNPILAPGTINQQVMTRENTPVAEGRPLPYGLVKALAEKEAEKYFPGRTLIVRPGLIVGPGDLTDRFTYWPVRIERGGEILAPGDGTDPVQIIDARDLCEWMIRLAEQGTMGIFNGLGPKEPCSFAQFLAQIKAGVPNSTATFTWIADPEFLAAQRVRAYQEMPVWRPARDGWEGFAKFDLTREIASGITYRSLTQTAKDTLVYYHSQPAERQADLAAGISAAREKEVLAAWRARKQF